MAIHTMGQKPTKDNYEKIIIEIALLLFYIIF